MAELDFPHKKRGTNINGFSKKKPLTEKDKFSVRDSGLEKGQKEIMEQKDNEIKKLTEKCETLQAEIRKLKTDKDAAEFGTAQKNVTIAAPPVMRDNKQIVKQVIKIKEVPIVNPLSNLIRPVPPIEEILKDLLKETMHRSSGSSRCAPNQAPLRCRAVYYGTDFDAVESDEHWTFRYFRHCCWS